MKYKIIVAVDKNNGIGLNNKLPWHFKSDMHFFKQMTISSNNNAIVMGKNTLLSINKKLPGRDNLILSSSLSQNDIPSGSFLFTNISDLQSFCDKKKYDNVWIIGGSSIYEQFLELNIISEIYITTINHIYDCDTFFPTIPSTFYLSQNTSEIKENNNILSFKKYYIK